MKPFMIDAPRPTAPSRLFFVLSLASLVSFVLRGLLAFADIAA
jgi:hypothetical protein